VLDQVDAARGRARTQASLTPSAIPGVWLRAGLGSVRTPRHIEQSLFDVFTQKTNAVLSNTPGPREPVYFAGSKIAGVVPWVPAAGTIGIGIDVMSYNGGVVVRLRVDARLIPDPETIIADYEREIDTLRRLAPRHRTRTATPN